MPARKHQLTDDLRILIVTNHCKGYTVKEISAYMGVPESTVRNTIKIFRTESRMVRKKRVKPPTNKKITESVKNFIDFRLSEDSTISLKRLKNEILSNFNVDICQSTIQKHLKAFNYSFKRLKCVSTCSITPVNIERRKEYVRQFYDLLTTTPDNNIFFIDEVGFCVAMRPKYGRSKVGTTPICRVPTLRSKNYSICCGINNVSEIFYVQQDVPFNVQTFYEFIAKFLD